jgi:hypothetical protein
MNILAVGSTAMKAPTHSQTEQQPRRADGPADPSTGTAEPDNEFGDEPTVSNVRNPAAQAGIGDSDDEPSRTPTGAYRLVRPATSDRLNPGDSALSVADKPLKKRTIIGITRKK